MGLEIVILIRKNVTRLGDRHTSHVIEGSSVYYYDDNLRAKNAYDSLVELADLEVVEDSRFSHE